MSPECPSCGSHRVWKAGLRHTIYGDVQRYVCNCCGFRFSENRTSFHRAIYAGSARDPGCQIGVRSQRGTKNLVVEEPLREGLAGATRQLPVKTKESIVNFIIQLGNDGYTDSTVESYARILGNLVSNNVDLQDPESVKSAIKNQKSWSLGRKNIAVHAYSRYAKMHGITWEPPRYHPPKKLPFIPSEKEINDLIAGSGYKIATFLQLLKETGMRAGEAFNLQWLDIDIAKNMVRITPEKRSNPRILKLSKSLMAMLERLQGKDRIFNYCSLSSLRRTFEKQRKRIAAKFGNPNIQRISFHTLRHWKATVEYNKTKDILWVKQLLGHKRLENTMKYTHLIDTGEDCFVTRVAVTTKDIVDLVDRGFEYVCEHNNAKIFRKRK